MRILQAMGLEPLWRSFAAYLTTLWSLYDWTGMIGELREIFGRDVDLLSPQALRNPFRRHEILKARESLYAA